MKTAILTDTNSGITAEQGRQLGIFVLPMPVIIDDKDYLEGIDITPEYLYESMRAGKNVSTSQPSPGSVMDIWDSILGSGFDELVYIPMSSALSNSCANAIQLALDYDRKVYVTDSHRISVPLRESILDAKKLSDQGMSGNEIKEQLEKYAYENSIYITVNTLEYLKKSGRVTPAAATLATMLNVKPILTIQGEKLDSYAKVRGMKQASRKMIEAIRHDLDTRFSQIPVEKMTIATAGTFEHAEDAEAWLAMVQEAFPEYAVSYYPLSCSITCHVGMNAEAIGAMVKL